VNEILSVVSQSVVEAPIKHATSAAAISTGAMVETTSSLMSWVGNGAIIMGLLLTTALFVHTLLKIQSQIRGER
jgi:hypothetical protein